MAASDYNRKVYTEKKLAAGESTSFWFKSISMTSYFKSADYSSSLASKEVKNDHHNNYKYNCKLVVQLKFVENLFQRIHQFNYLILTF